MHSAHARAVHSYTIQNCNDQRTGTPSGESGGDNTPACAIGHYPKPFDSVGSGAAHSHGSVKYTVERGSIQISPYTRDYDSTNSTVALNNNPGVGNSQLAMNPPYQSAIYIIKAF